MNERIRKLAHEAGLPTYNPEGIPTKLEKFAELLLKECVTICNDTNDASYLNGVIAGRKIKQHFGFEE